MGEGCLQFVHGWDTDQKQNKKTEIHTQRKKINVEDVRRGDREYGAGKSRSQACPAQQGWAAGGKVEMGSAQGTPDMLRVGWELPWVQQRGLEREFQHRAGNSSQG